MSTVWFVESVPETIRPLVQDCEDCQPAPTLSELPEVALCEYHLGMIDGWILHRVTVLRGVKP